MADPPRLTKLGAKWVEVRNGGQKASKGDMRADLKTWPATPVGCIARISLEGSPEDLSMLLLFRKGAAGVGQPFKLN